MNIKLILMLTLVAFLAGCGLSYQGDDQNLKVSNAAGTSSMELRPTGLYQNGNLLVLSGASTSSFIDSPTISWSTTESLLTAHLVQSYSLSSHGHDYSGTYLGLTAKAADADKLDNIDSTGFSLSGHTHDYSGTYLGLTAKASDSNLLDGVDSLEYVRKNIYTDCFMLSNFLTASTGATAGAAVFFVDTKEVLVVQGVNTQSYEATTPFSLTPTKVGSPTLQHHYPSGFCSLVTDGSNSGYKLPYYSTLVPAVANYGFLALIKPGTGGGVIYSVWDATNSRRAFYAKLTSSLAVEYCIYDEANDGYKTWTSTTTIPSATIGLLRLSVTSMTSNSAAVTSTYYYGTTSVSLSFNTSTTGTFNGIQANSSYTPGIARLYDGTDSFDGTIYNLYVKNNIMSFTMSSAEIYLTNFSNYYNL